MSIRNFRFPLTTTAIVIATVVLGIGFIWNVNIIDMPFEFFDRIEKSEIDEIITLFFLIGAGALGDRAIEARRTRARIETEQINAIHVTMNIVRGTVEDFLAQLNLLRADVQTDPKNLGHLEAFMFEQSVKELSSKLKAIEGLRLQNE
jgi:hypothetical protein